MESQARLVRQSHFEKHVPGSHASLGVTTEASEVDSDLELVAHTQANAPGNRAADTVRRMIEL